MSFKEKISPFMYGLLLGLLIAGAFFILKLDTYFKELNFYKKISQSVVKEEVPKETKEQKQAISPANNYKYLNYKKDTAKLSVKGDSLSDETKIMSDARRALDSVLVRDTSKIVYTAADGEDIVVKKDALLSAKNVEIVNLDPTNSGNTKKDSVLQQISGIHNEPEKPIYLVEYWQSPINYKGYKMARNKIILYGVNNTDPVKLYRLDERIYLRDQFTVYHLDYANDYRQLEKVTDEGLLAKLK